MKENMMNQTNSLRESVFDGYAAGVKAVAGDKPLHYLSTQITSGLHMSECAKKNGYDSIAEFKADEKMADEVKKAIAENCERSEIALNRWREKGETVVTPTTLDIPEFTQEDYAWFWQHFIEMFKPKMILSDGWPYSRGSRYEIQDALNADCVFYLADGTSISSEEVKSILSETTPLP